MTVRVGTSTPARNTQESNAVDQLQPPPQTAPQITATPAAPEVTRARVDQGTQGDARTRAQSGGADLQARLMAQVGGTVGTRPAATARAATGAGDVHAATAGMTEAQKYDYYRGVIEQGGGTVNDAPGARNMLAVRTETSTRANGGKGAYDDQMAMIWRDAQGVPHVREYMGNTEPSGQYEGRQGEDADRNGTLDQGRLRPGSYEFRDNGRFLGRRSMRMTGDAQVDRDTNHDGRFNDGVVTRGGGSMLIHRGGENGNSKGTWSAGCQTLPSREYDRFMRDLTDNGRGAPSLRYTLVNR